MEMEKCLKNNSILEFREKKLKVKLMLKIFNYIIIIVLNDKKIN
jgi:hypothetical protein